MKIMMTNLLKVSPLILSLFVFASCNEDKECSDEFVTSYQRMGDSFEKLYEPLSGSFELNALGEAIDLFLASHKDVSCTFEGKNLNPTKEAQAMKNSINSINASQAQSFESAAITKIIPKVIYGEDNRIEVSEASTRYQNWAGSTLAMVSPDEWDANYNYTSKTYGEALRLCPGERFENQLSVSVCSGFLVAPDVLVTAGHCIQGQTSCDNFKWVLDFKDNAQGTSADKVFSCKEIIKQKLESEGSLDYAVIRLDRPVAGRKFFRTRASGTIAVNTPLVLIGYPSGISAKVAEGAIVRSSNEANFFTTNTDSFGGNSGSAVINQQTGVVEGILVRGDEDFTIVDGPDGSRCREERVCSNDGCQGEEVTKMTSVEGIPVIADPATIRKGFYQDKNFPVLGDGLPLDFFSYNYGGYTLGGLKFLDRCGIHYFVDGNPNQWEGFHKGSCSDTNSIDQVIGAFSNHFYL